MMLSRVMPRRNANLAPAEGVFLPSTRSCRICQEFGRDRAALRIRAKRQSAEHTTSCWRQGSMKHNDNFGAKEGIMNRSCIGDAGDSVLAGPLSLHLTSDATGDGSSLPTRVHRPIQGHFSSRALLSMSGGCQASV